MTEWECPKCGAPVGDHGKGGAGECVGNSRCMGFVCECSGEGCDTDEHGTGADPCPNAYCYHCGWYGTFPIPPYNPKKLPAWAKRALAEGWKPPVGWAPKAEETDQ